MRKNISGEITGTHYSFRGLRKDGRLIDVEVIGSATTYGGKPAVIGSLLDITERKKADEDLRKMAAELARSNQDLEQFAYLASHDLQEPLRMVTGHLDLIQRLLAGKLDKKTRESMAFATDGAVRMQALIRGLLAYSRVGRKTEGFNPTDMEAVFRSATTNLAASIGEADASIQHEALPTVQAEGQQMVQLMQNLLGNAIKYRTANRRPELHVGARREGRGWVFWVRDNGIGIVAEDHDRIFMIFQRLHTRQEYSGTGIGLAICKRIVEYHCGRMWMESEVGTGSTFYFTIPDRPPS
jgi:light-regulated signal transduction histidine kinase (bacteriophytochrome)